MKHVAVISNGNLQRNTNALCMDTGKIKIITGIQDSSQLTFKVSY